MATQRDGGTNFVPEVFSLASLVWIGMSNNCIPYSVFVMTDLVMVVHKYDLLSFHTKLVLLSASIVMDGMKLIGFDSYIWISCLRCICITL
jgi:hypothetical protein